MIVICDVAVTVILFEIVHAGTNYGNSPSMSWSDSQPSWCMMYIVSFCPAVSGAANMHHAPTHLTARFFLLQFLDCFLCVRILDCMVSSTHACYTLFFHEVILLFLRMLPNCMVSLTFWQAAKWCERIQNYTKQLHQGDNDAYIIMYI